MSLVSFSKIRVLLIFFLVAMLALNAFGQTRTTGSMEGAVKDPTGANVAGVTVTVTSPNLMRPQSAVTASDGSYSILNLPPGKYTLIVEEGKGFAKFEERNIDVSLGRTSAADVHLQLAKAQAEVTVVEGAAMIDVVQTATGSNVTN